MKKMITLVLLLGITTIISCNKKSDPALTSEQLIATAKGWKLSAGTINPPIQIPGAPAGTPGISDFYNLFLESCEKDDITFFNANGQIKIDEGGTKCDPSDPQIKLEGTWAFNSGKTAINVTPASGTGDLYTLTISELNATTLKITQPFDFGTGSMSNLTLTYTALK